VRILADYHHSDLFESLALLFEDRLGWELFAPAGMEWFDEGYWQFERAFHGDAVARQYLEGIWAGTDIGGDYWREVADRTHPGRTLKGVTVEQARALRPDVVLCTLTHNERGMARFAMEVGATFGLQAGNVGQLASVASEGAGWGEVDFVLASTTIPEPIPVPHIIYRQEFSLTDFRFVYPPFESKSIASFVQCFPENRGPDRGMFYDEFLFLSRKYPEFDWKVYGAYGSAPLDELACGNLETTPKVAERMRAIRMAWHAKYWSDGYGHVIHNLHAVGRPIFAYHAYYADKLAAPLMIHGVTGFDLGQMDETSVIATLRRLRDNDEYHHQISAATAARFREVVDFARDSANVGQLLARVLP
jgi:hypothetical protein